MEFKKLQALLVIAEYESFSKAAVHLSVSQSLLSKYVTDLEGELGVRLLHRNGRGALLTPEGVRLTDYARRIGALVDEAQADLRNMREVPTGVVVVGVSSAIGATLTIPLVSAVRAAYPEVFIQIVEGISSFVHEALNTGRLDIAVVFDTHIEGAGHEHLVEEDLLLIGPATPDAALEPEVPGVSLAERPFVLTRQGSKLRGVIDGYTQRLGFHLRPIAEIDALLGLVGAVEAGLGCTILPFGAVRKELRQGHLRASRIHSPPMVRRVFLAESTERVPTRAQTLVVKVLKQVVSELDAHDRWRPTAEMLRPNG